MNSIFRNRFLLDSKGPPPLNLSAYLPFQQCNHLESSKVRTLWQLKLQDQTIALKKIVSQPCLLLPETKYKLNLNCTLEYFFKFYFILNGIHLLSLFHLQTINSKDDFYTKFRDSFKPILKKLKSLTLPFVHFIESILIEQYTESQVTFFLIQSIKMCIPTST